MVSGWQCSPKVITVANYNNRVQYLNFTGTVTNIVTNPPQVDLNIATTSSRGPTRTGLTKPDVTATGNTILTAGPKSILDGYKSSNPTVLAPGGMHVRNGGTSMASPVVAGMAAMILERYPNAGYAQVKSAIVNTCFADAYTGSVPNATWGYGKVHAYDALMAEVGCTDPTAANFNPFAQADDGSCVFPRLGTGTGAEAAYLAVRPNPINERFMLAYRLPTPEASITLRDLTGRYGASIAVDGVEGVASVDVSRFAQGIYVLTIDDHGSAAATHKVVIIR
jgi:hypothetical protein